MSLPRAEDRSEHPGRAARRETAPPLFSSLREAVLPRVHMLARNVSRGLAVFGLGMLLCLAVTVVADGLLRFFFAHPIDAVNDIGGVVAAVAVASCIPMVLVERGNMTIRLFSTFVGPRAGTIADTVAAVLVEIVLIGMAWQFYRYAAQITANGDATWMLHIPTSPFWWLVDAMMWVSVGVQAIVTVEYFAGYTPPQLHAEP